MVLNGRYFHKINVYLWKLVISIIFLEKLLLALVKVLSHLLGNKISNFSWEMLQLP